MRPRPYLSFSQMATFDMSPERYVAEYLHKQKRRITRNMASGSLMAESLEREEFCGDPLLDIMMARIPKLEVQDKPILDPNGHKIWFKRDDKHEGEWIKIPVLKDGKGVIPLLAVPDTATKDYRKFKEYKQSVRKWTPRMADQSHQVTFYATTIYLLAGFIPDDIELVNVPVAYDEEHRLVPTGEIVRLKTSRSMSDVIKMTKHMRDDWHGIGALCEKELF